MRTISGHYTNKFENPVAFSVEIPSEWNELSASQYSGVLEILTFYRNAGEYTIAASIISLLFGPKNFHIIDNLPDEDLHSLVPLTNFVLETQPPVKNFFPTIKTRRQVMIAANDSLGNLGFGEWCFAYQFYTYYIQTQNIAYLHKLIATIYRPADLKQSPESIDYTGDMREIFNENLLESRARAVQDIKPGIKAAIYGWLSAAFMAIQEARPNAFPEPEKDEEGNIKPDTGGDPRTWLTVFRELLGPKWGTTEQLKYTNAMFVLDHMEEQQLEFKKSTAVNS